MIWSIKRNRKPDGTLDKYKVVSWSSVIIMMTPANLHLLHIKAVDFVQAYPQAKVKTTIFLKTPTGVILNSKGKEKMVLVLLKKPVRLEGCRPDLLRTSDIRADQYWVHIYPKRPLCVYKRIKHNHNIRR